jgi:phosphoribosyl-ATP pyrophosphohydrolase/phosphoribosyl-AMP cyclohydrolase
MKLKFNKYSDGLIPAVVQDSETSVVLKLGFMSRKALKRTIKTGHVTFHSRSRKRIWTKGEVSGEFLKLVDIKIDCDADTLLIKAKPSGQMCHKGKDTCFGENNEKNDVLFELERFVMMRKKRPARSSVTTRLLDRGRTQIAKKVGEEAVELVIEALDVGNDDLFKNEASDLLYHFIALLAEREVSLDEVLDVLRTRRR